jgi:hypothetical protein
LAYDEAVGGGDIDDSSLLALESKEGGTEHTSFLRGTL